MRALAVAFLLVVTTMLFGVRDRVEAQSQLVCGLGQQAPCSTPDEKWFFEVPGPSPGGFVKLAFVHTSSLDAGNAFGF